MKKVSVDMGSYYSTENGLVKTISRAVDVNGDNPMIMFVYVQKGGLASVVHYMREADFIATYIS